jgi:hypothetical protein
VTLRGLYAVFLAVLVSQLGCNPHRGFPIVESGTPPSDQEILAAMAITRAVISPGDVPDVGDLDRNSAIVLSTATNFVTMQGDKARIALTERSLPHKSSLKFALLTPEQIQAVADDRGDFIYLEISEIRETSDGALVSIGTRWAVAKNSQVAILGGGGYMLRFRKHGSRWIFDGVVWTWIS